MKGAGLPVAATAVAGLAIWILSRAVSCPFQRQLIRKHGDELAVGGLVFGRAYLAAKGAVERVDAPAVPGNLNGVADGALHLAGAGAKMLGDGESFFTSWVWSGKC